MSILDTHFHVWDPATRDHAWLAGLPALNRRISIEDYEAVAHNNGVSQAVLVQVLNDLGDTRDFLAIAASHEIVAGVVGWVPLESQAIADEIAALREAPGGDALVAIRHLIQDEGDNAYATRPTVIAGVRAVAAAGLAYDIVIRSHQLPAAIALARAVEDCRFVLDHGAKPPFFDADGLLAWERQVAELSRLDHVACKLSGLVTEAGSGWRDVDVKRCFSHLIECFGTERVMYGSDWPVSSDVARYDEVRELCASALGDLSAAEAQAVWSDNGRRIYQLGHRA
ncbi:MAG: amidohydrolase family protein [Actinomycetota bacterium]|nr:amidohydrolase family protein [Actinomycetota bacterium]